MILSSQSIRKAALVSPLLPRTEIEIEGKRYSYGLSASGYDLRLAMVDKSESHIWKDKQKYWHLEPGEFVLASAQEYFTMPHRIMGIVHDKSSWARQGMAAQNTVVEAGWHGYLTLELTNHGKRTLILHEGVGICQVIFHWLDEVTEQPYNGKYSGQGPEPTHAI